MGFGGLARFGPWILFVASLQMRASFLVTDVAQRRVELDPVQAEAAQVAISCKIDADGAESYVPKFIPVKMLKPKDIFSAAWWMSRERFQVADLDRINIVEDDVFIPIKKAGQGFIDARLTKNWLEFSIQHVSKWQKLMSSKSNNKRAVRFMQSYISQQQQQRKGNSSTTKAMSSTLAMIALGIPDKTELDIQEVWKNYLCATISSLLHHSPKRIVVVGHYEVDRRLANQAFEFLRGIEDPQSENSFTQIQDIVINGTELGYVHVSKVKTRSIPKNVPYGALLGLQSEWKGSRQPSNVTQGSFFGKLGFKRNDFKYLYFTEADQILLGGPAHHRALSSGALLQELEQGRVLIPHRLQPLPHGDDWPSGLAGVNKVRALFNRTHHDTPVIENYDIDPSTEVSCCDVPPEQFYGAQICRRLWWTCGYGWMNQQTVGNFSYFNGFDLFRPSTIHGIPIVTLAGNGHGRSCRMQRGACS